MVAPGYRNGLLPNSIVTMWQRNSVVNLIYLNINSGMW